MEKKAQFFAKVAFENLLFFILKIIRRKQQQKQHLTKLHYKAKRKKMKKRLVLLRRRLKLLRQQQMLSQKHPSLFFQYRASPKPTPLHYAVHQQKLEASLKQKSIFKI